MKVSREQAGQNRERVLSVAGKLFRERGFGGIGVAEVMKGADLTHGGFYGQFDSKEDLMAESCARAMGDGLGYWQGVADRAKGDPLAAVMKAYLSTAHRDHPGQGCAMAALGPEVARQGPALRRTFTEGAAQLVGFLAGLASGRTKAARRKKALAAYAAMVGAMVLARAVDDDGFSREILESVAQA